MSAEPSAEHTLAAPVPAAGPALRAVPRTDGSANGTRGVRIRVARPDEYERVGEVSYLGFGHGEPGAAQPSPERLQLLRDAAARAVDAELLVAVDADDRILGTATLLRPGSELTRQSRDGEAELRLLAVLPEARRLGLGGALMREAIERARDWGVPALVLDTGPNNHRSQRLYHTLGFERVPERETRAASRGGKLAVFRYDYRASEGVLVRLVRPQEYEAVAQSLLAAYEHDYDIRGPYRDSILQVEERAKQHETWVAIDRADGTLLGSVVTGRPGELITPIGRPGELDFRLLGVDPAARRRGIGRLLVEHVLTLARLRGARGVVMNSGVQMTPAHRLYEQLGFQVLTERVRTRPEGHVSLAFGIELPGPADAAG